MTVAAPHFLLDADDGNGLGHLRRNATVGHRDLDEEQVLLGTRIGIIDLGDGRLEQCTALTELPWRSSIGLTVIGSTTSGPIVAPGRDVLVLVPTEADLRRRNDARGAPRGRTPRSSTLASCRKHACAPSP